jgi:hypothetical protein
MPNIKSAFHKLRGMERWEIVELVQKILFRAFLSGAVLTIGICLNGGLKYPAEDNIPPPISLQVLKIFAICFAISIVCNLIIQIIDIMRQKKRP